MPLFILFILIQRKVKALLENRQRVRRCFDSSFRARRVTRTLNDKSSRRCGPGHSHAPLAVGLMLIFMPFASSHGQQLTPDQQADMILSSARRAYNEKNYTFAATRFREFLGKFGNHKDANSARYGLALALLDTQPPDVQGALEQLQPLAGNKDFAEYPFVLYYLGAARRTLGIKELDQALAKPGEAAQRRAQAQPHFEEAGRQFAAATQAFAARVKDSKPDVKELSADLEWSAHARCDQAEMLLRTLKPKEALAISAPFVKDAPL